jgi:hypothetical protein
MIVLPLPGGRWTIMAELPVSGSLCMQVTGQHNFLCIVSGQQTASYAQVSSQVSAA